MAVWSDIRFAIRTMGRNPAVALLAIFALALGIGANTAIFSLVNGILLNSAAMRSLRNPGSLVMLWDSNPKLGSIISERMPTAPENFLEWKRQSHSFADMAAAQLENCNVTGGNAADAGSPERVDGMRISLNFFPLLGIQPALGRMFSREDLQRKDNVAILSANLYRRRFGNGTALRGQTLRINGIPRTIMGVLPATLKFPGMYGGMNDEDPQVWLPLDPESARGDDAKQRLLYIYARLKPGATLAQARSEMSLIGKRLEGADPRLNKGFGVNVFPLAVENVGPDLRSSLLVLQAAVAFVLLIACANLANLLLARAVGREREMATRLALGARPGRIVRQLLTESLVLSVLGAAAGLLLAHWILTGLSSLAPQDTQKFKELHLDPIALIFTFLVALVTGLLFGLAPAWHAARRDVNDVLARGGRASSRASNRLRGGLVIAEVALAFILLIGAGLMIRSLGALLEVNTGLRPDHLLTMQISLPPSRYADASQKKTFCDRLLEGVKRLPGVRSAAITDGLPMESIAATAFTVPGEPVIPNESPIADHAVITEDYFQTMGTPLLRGRTFTRANTEFGDPRVVVLNQSLAKIHWPKGDELGKTIFMPVSGNKRLQLTIIGVVADTRQLGPDSPSRPELYTPSRIYATPFLAVRTSGDPMKMAPVIEKIVWSIDPEQPVYEVHTMEEILHEWVAQRRFNMVVLSGFATLALVLASLGLYGVLAYLVTLRTRELGVRMAVGAAPSQLVRLVIGQAIKWAAPGLLIGVAGALLLTHAMQGLILNVSPVDPLTFAGVAAILMSVALLASYLPARRAARVDPVEALRVE